jgi:glycosyltransferase involved in cell wall biosynthesis
MNLLKGWPQDCLAQIHVEGDAPDTVFCARNRALTFDDLSMPLAVNKLLAAWRRRRITTRDAMSPTTQQRGDPMASQADTAFGGAKTSMKSALMAGLMSFAAYRLSKELRQWITDFRPDVIYTLLEQPWLTAFVRRVSQAYRIPVVPHFMDDWITISMRGDTRQGRFARRFLKNTLDIMAEAPVRMVIGERMAEEYRKRYGVTFLPFMNCCEVGPYHAPIHNRGGKFVFAYCGNFHLNRWRPLKDIGNALCELRGLGLDAELQVTSGVIGREALKELGAIDSIRLLGSLPLEEVSSVMRRADCLVFVESFDENVKTYMRYSLSAKLPEYFCAGRPVLAYGPGDIASILYIQQCGAGISVTEPDAKKLRDALQRLIQDEALRLALGKQAYCAAKDRHDAVMVRDAFRKAIASAVRGDQGPSQCSQARPPP